MTVRRATYEPPQPRYALGSGIVGCLGSLAFLMSPILLVVLTHTATPSGFAPPLAVIAVPVLAGCALAAGLLALTALSRSRCLAWTLACAAVAVAVTASVFPAYVTS